MKDAKKIRLFISLGLILAIAFLCGLGFLFNRMMKPNKQVINSSIEQKTISEESSNSQTTSQSSSESERIKDNSNQLSEFLSVYFTWDLTEESVDERSLKLKDMMSPSCYESLSIESDATTLKEMIQKYESTKEINTSNSTQLIASQYISSQVYQDTNNDSIYYVEVTINQKVPYQEAEYTRKESYQFLVKENLVHEIKRSNP